MFLQTLFYVWLYFYMISQRLYTYLDNKSYHHHTFCIPTNITPPKTTNRFRNIPTVINLRKKHHQPNCWVSLSCNSPKPPCRCQSMAKCNQSSLHLGTKNMEKKHQRNIKCKTWSKHRGKYLIKSWLLILDRWKHHEHEFRVAISHSYVLHVFVATQRN